jgi:hypothetical protein
VAEALGGELFGVAAVFDEGRFEGGDLAVEEEVCLVDQADGGVSTDRRVGVVEPVGVEGPAFLIRQIVQI